MAARLGQKKRFARGQAMVEYSYLNAIIVMGLLVVGNAPFFNYGAPYAVRRSLIELFLEAFQAYYDSFYFVLSLPFP